MIALETKNLKKQYGSNETLVKALDDVSIKIEKGTFLAVIGSSGSGKSTLLNMLGGLDIPTSGGVIVNGQKLSEMSEDELTVFRRREIGFVFQDFNLMPNLSVYDNIVLPLELDGQKIDKDYLDKILISLNIREKLKSNPNELSGGQQQRVAIARALITKPAIILADEPTGNLDSNTSQEVVGLLKTTSQKFHQTIIMITHNEMIAGLADEVIRIEDGKVVNFGDVHES